MTKHERAVIQQGYASQIYEVGRKGSIDDFLQEGFRLWDWSLSLQKQIGTWVAGNVTNV